MGFVVFAVMGLYLLISIGVVKGAIAYARERGKSVNLLLTGAAIHATGNALDNILTGNALDNVLAGGEGNDTYRFARQSGNDLLIDGGANRIALESGLVFADIAHCMTKSATIFFKRSRCSTGESKAPAALQSSWGWPRARSAAGCGNWPFAAPPAGNQFLRARLSPHT